MAIAVLIITGILTIIFSCSAITVFIKYDKDGSNIRLITSFALLAVAIFTFAFGYLFYKNMRYDEIQECIDANYEIYIDGNKVEPQKIDIKNYNIDNIKIDTNNKYILINGSTRRAI